MRLATLDRPRSLVEVRALIESAPGADSNAAAAAHSREATLTKPAGALGRLEDIAAWLSAWQGRHPPRVGRIQVIVFAGSHGVTARGVSAYPAEVTAQMVANFQAGGAAINQLSNALDASLSVVPLNIDEPTGDISIEPAMEEAACLDALHTGVQSVDRDADLLCLGEMGIGNTTVAAALAAALFGGTGADWAGRGTGIDDQGLERKQGAIDAALVRYRREAGEPLAALRHVGGRELAAIVGAVLAARHGRVPVLLDGFACTAAAAVLQAVRAGALGHCLVSHLSVEPGHRRLLDKLGMEPLLDLGMRLGEASGAALAAGLVRSAAVVHGGMASFTEADVSGPA